MWTTVLLLAVALNFEPSRIGLVPLMLTRPRPLVQLSAFLCGSLAISVGLGLSLLFFIHYRLGAPTFEASTVQIAMGLLALVAAAVVATHPRFAGKPAAEPVSVGASRYPAPPTVVGPLQILLARARSVLPGGSPWIAGATGVMCGLPSVDSLALLALIAASGTTAPVQVAAFLTFVTIGNVVVALPILCHVVAPDRTRGLLTRFRDWVTTHRRQYIAGLLAVAGVLLTVIGVAGM